MDTRRRKYLSASYRYSFARLVLNYYLYYEETWEIPDTSDEEKEDAEEFGRILKEFLDGEDALEDLDKLRKRIIAKVEVLTGFSDCFQIYEYVLNRTERRFIPMTDSRYTPESLAGALVNSIAGEASSARQNERLQNIVAQLPVRFTKQKFYSMVMERLTVYRGLNKDSVEGFLDRLKSSVMLSLPKHMEQEEELYGILETLKQTDYRAMDKEKYQQCTAGIVRASSVLMDSIDRFVMIITLVNDLYVLFLTGKEAMIDAVEDQTFRRGAAGILDALKNNDKGFLDEEGDELLSRMEGIQESVEHMVMSGGEEGDEIQSRVNKLVSGSHFMPLDNIEVSEEIADREWVEKRGQEFCKELDGMFGKLPKAVMRAVMAKVLSSLPVIFNDGQEVEEYIRSSLESCSDHSEREACMELLEQELITDVMV